MTDGERAIEAYKSGNQAMLAEALAPKPLSASERADLTGRLDEVMRPGTPGDEIVRRIDPRDTTMMRYEPDSETGAWVPPGTGALDDQQRASAIGPADRAGRPTEEAAAAATPRGPPGSAENVASGLIAQAERAERTTTPALQSVAAKNGATMVGLDYRLKGQDSLSRKVATDAGKKGITNEAAGADIADVLRYTMTAPAKDYTRMVQTVGDDLRTQGYRFTKVKNTWGPQAPYRGINTQMEAPDGSKFELQFHTPESFDTKQNLQHADYEEWRTLPPDSDRARFLNQRMADRAAALDMPPGVKSVDLGAADNQLGGW